MESEPPKHSGRRGPALLTALVVALTVTLAPVLPQGAARAATQGRVSVSRSVSSRVVLTGDRVRVSGRVSPAAARTPVRLQRLQRHRWTTLILSRPRANGDYLFTFTSKVAGTRRFRVLAGHGGRGVSSRSFVVKVLACAPGEAPARGTAAWFTRPKQRGLDPVAAHLSRLFCAAAPHSTIDISMYFIRAFGSQPDVRPILTSLRRAVRYHRVRVRILLEGRLYGRGKPLRAGLGPLRRFATVILCHDGCHNERSVSAPGHGIMHHKFVTISDMSWSRSADPVVVESSANWSQTQLGNAWQSAVLFYDDHELYRELHIQFETLATCATGCAGWTRRMAQLGLPATTYGLSDVRRLWRDAAPAERKAAPGSGRGVVFSPWPRQDPLAVALNGYTCTPAHHTVLVDHMFVTAGRQPVIDALAGLARRGCRVRVILQKLTHSPLADGARRIRAAGLPVSCVARLHDKVVLVNAVRSADGRADKALWTGSQSLGGRALRFNDEALLRVSTADAAGAARVANAALYSRFLGSWKALARHRQTC